VEVDRTTGRTMQMLAVGVSWLVAAGGGAPGVGGWSATHPPLFGASAEDRALMGLLVVDGPDEVPDPEARLFLISHWADAEDPSTFRPAARFLMSGRGWPHTERLEYAQGDTVRWRVVNQSGAFHPMHLHGFYFEVTSWTSQTGAPFIPPAQGGSDTETMPPGVRRGRTSWGAWSWRSPSRPPTDGARRRRRGGGDSTST